MAWPSAPAGSASGSRIRVSSKDGQARLAVERPRAFAAWPGEALLSLEGEDQEGTLLGTAFGLRLARNLAGELGGSLKIGEQRLTLRLPAALDHEVGSSLPIDVTSTFRPQPPAAGDLVAWPDSFGARFVVFVDTEEEFDWSQPLARENRSVSAVSALPAAQARFAASGVAARADGRSPHRHRPGSIDLIGPC